MNLSANVILKPESNDRYQLIYASQVYQTFFTIYGRFKVNEGKLTQVDLRLINFKGRFNIGIKDASIEMEIVDRTLPDLGAKVLKDIDIKCISIDIDIQALNPETTKSLTCDIDLTENNDNLFLEVTRDLVAIEGDMEGLIFDDEFYYRDGLAGKKEINKKGFSGYQIESKKKKPTTVPRDPGGLCPRGYSKIYS